MDDLAVLGTKLRDEERRIERQVGEARSVALQGKQVKAEVGELSQRIEALDEAAAVLNGYADSRQVELQTKIESIVTHGLRTIFGDDMSFHIKASQTGKYPTALFTVRSLKDGQTVETNIMDARGGGVAAVTGFILRLILLLLKPNARPVLFLDETFAQLSEEYEPALAEFMKELVERTPVQILMVTHSHAYDDVADKTYRFFLDDGVTRIESA